MTPEHVQLIATVAGPGLVGLLVWSLRRNVKDVDDQVKLIATDVRQLAAQGARHGEALAGGVVKFAALEKRLDKVESRQEKFSEDCIACRTERDRK